MNVRILSVTEGMPLEVNRTYKVNFETKEHYTILNEGIWCGIFKNKVEIVEEVKELDNGQLAFIFQVAAMILKVR